MHTASVSVSVSDLVSDTIGYHNHFVYLILILTRTLKVNRYVQCAQAVTKVHAGISFTNISRTILTDEFNCVKGDKRVSR